MLQLKYTVALSGINVTGLNLSKVDVLSCSQVGETIDLLGQHEFEDGPNDLDRYFQDHLFIFEPVYVKNLKVVLHDCEGDFATLKCIALKGHDKSSKYFEHQDGGEEGKSPQKMLYTLKICFTGPLFITERLFTRETSTITESGQEAVDRKDDTAFLTGIE